MSQAQLRDPSVVPAQAVHPWFEWRWLSSVLILLFIAISSAQGVLQLASACRFQVGVVETAAIALVVLITGAAFNWVSMDLLLVEVLPIAGHPSITLSILISVVLMASAIRAVSIALQSRRSSSAGVGWLMVAGLLAWMYATSSALGFCVIARTWLM
jgi:hypothetical protein